MPCTTLLVGRNASNDQSTMIARTDDGFYDVKKVILVRPEDQPRKYKSVLSHVSVDLPDNPMAYTASPSVDRSEGIWAAAGINEANVGMSATETITSNPRVLSADPLVVLEKAKGGKKEVPGGIGEEDMVTLVLPYIRTAREGVLRLASLLEQYGTYESNGIAFNDEKEVWWMETIGGHHWIARRVPDDACVIAPNQFGMDAFDMDDAMGEGKDHLCSRDLADFIREGDLDCNQKDVFNPRDIFGSHTDWDHLYNTPRAWYMGRCLTPYSHKWEGEGAEFGPESDNIPWCLVPDRRVTVEDVKYILSAHFQGTDYDPYRKGDTGKKGMYRSIGISRTGVTAICQIRSGAPEKLRGIEWVIFGPTTFAAAVPIYTAVGKIPAYLSRVTLDVSTDNLYWASRLLAVMSDAHYGAAFPLMTRYENAVMTKCRQILREYDRKMKETGDFSLTEEANEKICAAVKDLTRDTLNKITKEASVRMKNEYSLADN